MPDTPRNASGAAALQRLLEMRARPNPAPMTPAEEEGMMLVALDGSRIPADDPELARMRAERARSGTREVLLGDRVGSDVRPIYPDTPDLGVTLRDDG